MFLNEVADDVIENVINDPKKEYQNFWSRYDNEDFPGGWGRVDSRDRLKKRVISADKLIRNRRKARWNTYKAVRELHQVYKAFRYQFWWDVMREHTKVFGREVTWRQSAQNLINYLQDNPDVFDADGDDDFVAVAETWDESVRIGGRRMDDEATSIQLMFMEYANSVGFWDVLVSDDNYVQRNFAGRTARWVGYDARKLLLRRW